MLHALARGAAALATAVAAPAPVPASTSAHACPSGRVEAIGPQARVVRHDGVLYGCARQNDRVTVLGGQSCLGPGGRVRASNPHLAGPVVALVHTSCGVDTAAAEVVSRDLRSGRTLRSSAAALRAAGPESFTDVTALVVDARGDLAWISQTRSIATHRSTVELDRVDQRGAAVLDTGGGVSGLRLRGRRLRWWSSGKRRSEAV